MRKKLPILMLAIVILLQAFAPATFAASKNEATVSTVYFCPSDTTSEGAGKATYSELKQTAQFLKNKGLSTAQRREVIEAFNSGAEVVKLDKDLVVYRYSGGAANPRGRWLTTEKLPDPINQLALPPGSTAENVTQWVIPKGTEVLRGTVAPNFGRPGLAPQIYLPDPSVLK